MNKQSKVNPDQTTALKRICKLTNKTKWEIDYFITGPGMEANTAASVEATLRMYDEFSDVLNGTGCFKGSFFLQVNDDPMPYQVPPKCTAYVLQVPFKNELERIKH